METSASELLTIWEQRIDGYMMRDPAISIMEARKAARDRENFYRGRIADGKIDPNSFLEENSSAFRRRQLEELGLNPETLEIRQVQG